MVIDSKLPGVGTSIFTVMSQLAQETDAINLAQGFPSFQPPERLRHRVAHYIEAGANQYAPSAGLPALLQAIADKLEVTLNERPNPDTELTICTGATEGMFSAISALIKPEDDVVVLDPAYDAYAPAINLAGGRVVHVPLNLQNDVFYVDWQRVRDALTPATRAIILNFPHNPTGTILNSADLDALADIVESSQILIFSDEVYEHIVFDGQAHLSPAGHPRLRSRSLVVSSFGKTFHATGWKMGYVLAPPELTDEFRKVHQFATFSVNTPVQYALADFMGEHPDYYQELVEFYERKRDLFVTLLAETRFSYVPAASTFFQLVDYSDVSELNDVEMAKRLTCETGVAAIPLSVFCDVPFTGRKLRLCFAKEDEELERAVARLTSL